MDTLAEVATASEIIQTPSTPNNVTNHVTDIIVSDLGVPSATTAKLVSHVPETWDAFNARTQKRGFACFGCGKRVSTGSSINEQHMHRHGKELYPCVYCIPCIANWLHNEQMSRYTRNLQQLEDSQYPCPNSQHCECYLSATAVKNVRNISLARNVITVIGTGEVGNQEPFPNSVPLIPTFTKITPKKKKSHSKKPNPIKVALETTIHPPPPPMPMGHLFHVLPPPRPVHPDALLMKAVIEHVPGLDDSDRHGLVGLLSKLEDMIIMDSTFCRDAINLKEETRHIEALVYLLNRQMMANYYLLKARQCGLSLTAPKQMNMITQCLLNDDLFEQYLRPYIDPSFVPPS